MENENETKKQKWPMIVTNELMSIRGELGILSVILAEMEGIDNAKKEKFVEIADRNLKKVKQLEEVYNELLKRQDEENTDIL